MNQQDLDRCLALAGIFQAARLAQQFAREGKADQEAWQHSIKSIFITDPKTIEEVYGGVSGVRTGLELISERMVKSTDPLDMEMLRYIVILMHLAKKMSKQQSMSDAIAEGVSNIAEQSSFFETEHSEEIHSTTITKLAELYRLTISTLQPQVMVEGDVDLLKQPIIAEKIRAALLSGIRSAHLWHQLGGNRFRILFMRRQITRAAKELLEKNKK
jgi:high frequency lysogenization protein